MLVADPGIELKIPVWDQEPSGPMLLLRAEMFEPPPASPGIVSRRPTNHDAPPKQGLRLNCSAAVPAAVAQGLRPASPPGCAPAAGWKRCPTAGIRGLRYGFALKPWCTIPADAKRLAALVRGHWSVEKRCHWVLDVDFGEDHGQVRDPAAAHNRSILREMALKALRNETSKGSLRSKRKRASLDPSFRLALLLALQA